MRYAGEKKFNFWTVLTLILLALFLLFVIYPIGMLLAKSLFAGGQVDLSYFVKFFTKKYYWGTLVNSFKVTITSTLVAVLIGLPMAYLLRNVKIPGSGLLNILIVISYLSPPFIGAYIPAFYSGGDRMDTSSYFCPSECQGTGGIDPCGKAYGAKQHRR